MKQENFLVSFSILLKIENLEIKLENKKIKMAAVIATPLCDRLENPITFLCSGEMAEGFAGVENMFDDHCQEKELVRAKCVRCPRDVRQNVVATINGIFFSFSISFSLSFF
jgi:hypothetical protein